MTAIAPLTLLLDFARAEQAGEPYGFRFGPQTYLLRSAGGGVKSAELPWDESLLADLDAVRKPGRDPAIVQRIGELLRSFLDPIGFGEIESQILTAVAAQRPVFLSVRSAAAELYILPWELLALRGTGQHLAELPTVLIRYEWPETTTAAEQPTPRGEGGRILFAWSAAGGAVPAADHLAAIVSACSTGFYPFEQDRDVLPQASCEKLSATLAAAQKEGRPISVLHVLCHGTAIGSTFGLSLDGDSSTGEAASVDAGRLRQILAPYSGMVRLVVLMACDSGNLGAVGNQLGSVAQTLHRAGMAQVVASRFPLSVASSARLTAALYDGLARDCQSLEQSLLAARARLALDATQLDWASVQLYARANDGTDARPLIFRPYRGLLPFGPEHRRFFFGREKQAEEVRSDLAALMDSKKPSFLIVAGASGTGKSSLVLAKIVPELCDQKGYTMKVLRPSMGGPAALDALAHSRDGAQPKLLLVVDQFEEIFTALSAEARQSFAQKLWAIAGNPQANICVMPTLRVDFVGQCGEIVLDAQGLRLDAVAYNEEHRVFIPQLDTQGLRQMIEQPAARVGLELEASLADRMLADVGGEPGALPLLEYTLDKLWQGRKGRTLTQADYQALGGVGGALEQDAEKLIETFNTVELGVARRLLLALVAVAEGHGLDTRQRRRLADVRPTEAAAVRIFDQVVERFVAARLLVRSEADHVAVLEIAHESLIRRWQRLRGYIEEGRADRLFYNRITSAAELWWKDKEHGAGRLWRQPDFDLLAEYRKHPTEEWSPLHEGFFQESRKQLRNERLLRWGAITLLPLALVIILLVIYREERRTSSIEHQRAENERKLAEGERKRAHDAQEAMEGFRQLHLSTMVEQGRDLLLERNKPFEALLFLHRAQLQKATDPLLPRLLHDAMRIVDVNQRQLGGPKIGLASAEWSPDGQRIVTAGRDGKLRVYDPDSGRLLSEIPGKNAFSFRAMYSADGKHVLVEDPDGLSRVWNMDTGKLACELRGNIMPTDGWRSTFSPDGKFVATAGNDKQARIFEISTCRMIFELKGHKEQLTGVAYSRDGRRLVTSSHDRTAIIFESATGKIISRLKGHEDSVTTATFSPDGKWVITGSNDHQVRVFETTTGVLFSTYEKHASGIMFAAQNPVDGRRARQVVTAAWGKEVTIWDGGRRLADLPGHTSPLRSVSFSPNGSYVLTLTSDGISHVFSAGTGMSLGQLTPGAAQVGKWASFSPDSSRVVAVYEDGTARVFRLDPLRLRADVNEASGPVLRAIYSPDSRRIVTADVDNNLRVLDAETLKEVAAYTEGQPTALHDVAFSPDGRTLITASQDSTLRIFDAETLKLKQEMTGHNNGANSVMFSANGRRILSAGQDSLIRIWDAQSTKMVREINVKGFSNLAARFSPNGQRIVAVDRSNLARVFDAESGQQVLELAGHTAEVVDAEYSPDGLRIVTSSGDRTARIWNAETGKPLAELIGHTQFVTSAVFSSDGRTVLTGSNDNTVRLFDAETGRSLIEPLMHEEFVHDASFAPDKRHIVTVDHARRLRVWDLVIESRKADELSQLIRCYVPVRFVSDDTNVIAAATPDPTPCESAPRAK